MHTNNNHNNWSAGQLSNIIDSIRDSNNGKCSIRMVAERIGRGEWETWLLVRDAGLRTRLYEESLESLDEQIRAEASSCTVQELFERYGGSWKDVRSFRVSLCLRKILTLGKPRAPGLKASRQLQDDVLKNGYDLSTLTTKEISEMYGLPVASVLAITKRHNIPHKKAPRGRQSKVKA
jgi:hypothetical protein